MSLAAFWFGAIPLQALAILFAGVWGAFKQEGKPEPARIAYWLAIIFAGVSLTIAANAR